MHRLIIVICFLTFFTSFKEPISNECDIEAFYSGSTLKYGSKVLSSGGSLEDAELLLTPMDIERGKYVVNITRKGSNLYKVDNKNIYIVTKYCYEYSYSQEVVLSVESNYGYTKGKIIF
jgi:hypothetical protein